MRALRQCQMSAMKILIFFIIGIFFFASAILPPASGADNESILITVTPQQIFQGDIAVLKTSPSSFIKSLAYVQQGRTVPFMYDQSAHAHTAILGIDLDESPGAKEMHIKIVSSNGHELTKKISFTVLAKDFSTQHLSLPESKVTLSSNDLARHEQEQAIVDRIFTNTSSVKLRGTGFIQPVKGASDTPFGVRRFMNNKPRNSHSGIDFKADQGAPVVASSDGIITYTGDHFFSGNSIFIDHGLGIITMYFHLSSILAKPGESVQKGAVIGRVGSTGRSTGPHLHWGMRINNQRVDPMALLKHYTK